MNLKVLISSLSRVGLRTILMVAVGCAFVFGAAEMKARKPAIPAEPITVGKAFLLIPQQDLDLLTMSMRQDMLDYMEQRDSIYKKANVYMGLSWIEKMEPGYMRVRLSDVSDLQIKLLPLTKSTLPLVMTVYTIDDGNGTADSTVKFFDNAMQEIPTSKFISLPRPDDFYDIPKDSPVSRKDIEEAMPFYTMAVTVNPQTGALTGRMTSANSLTREEEERLKPYLRKELRWSWNGSKMQLMK
ncbi:MAG: DUF3256 family protein [Muribaculaceae bacterium]|nr:DUF3256 family protein [Muribaculaceae bacterium]